MATHQRFINAQQYSNWEVLDPFKDLQVVLALSLLGGEISCLITVPHIEVKEAQFTLYFSLS